MKVKKGRTNLYVTEGDYSSIPKPWSLKDDDDDDGGMELKSELLGFKMKKIRLLLIRGCDNKGSVDLFWNLKREGDDWGE